MQPHLLMRELLAREDIRRPKDRPTGKMTSIDGNEQDFFVLVMLCEGPGYFFGVLLITVHADERRGDIGLLKEVREAEAYENTVEVDDCGSIFGAEALVPFVLRLGAGTLHAINEGWECSVIGVLAGGARRAVATCRL